MRAADLDLRELLEADDQQGVLRFGGDRALVFDAVALGVLRGTLVRTLGESGARAVLTRFGYAHGWRTAESMKRELPWDSEAEWRRAGGRLHALMGFVRVEPIPERELEGPEPLAHAIWRDSFEAEQHLLHCGQASSPVCWTLCGFASGYLSYCHGKPIYFVEDRCVARGDAVCRVIGKPRDEWGEELGDFVTFFEHDCLNHALQKVAAQLKKSERRLKLVQSENARLGADEVSGIVAKSDGMRRVLELARRAAKVDSTVLVTGESGVGKERVTRLIHDESARVDGPFVAVNCAALSETLLESELFGHTRGAFTGATADRAGLFEAAHGGTLFLDEVGEVSLSMQAKILRTLQEREVRRVGENRSRKVDVRLVAATNRDLAEEVKRGTFRKDLYYRLRVIELKVPPLRDRKDDILPLARLLIASAAQRMSRDPLALTSRAADQLLRYEWPGNVRELENAMERALALASGRRIDLEDLPEEIRDARPQEPASAAVLKGRALEDVERAYILSTLEENDFNQARTAEQLQIGTATLYRKLKAWGALPKRA